jgi:hypothetical protein
MQLSKSRISTILGLFGLLLFIVLAYVQNYIFIDKILICSLILGLILFIKMRGEVHNSNEDSNVY